MDTLANKNNNPGNIKDPSTGQFKQFASPQEGYAALLNDLEIKKSGKSQTGLKPESTLVDFAKVYAPSSDKNNPAQYAANIANHMKIRPDAAIGSLDVGKWAEAVAHSEGYQGSASQQPIQPVSQVTSPKPEENKTGFVQGLVRGIAQLPLTVLSSGNALLNAGNEEAYNKIQKEGTDFGYFGKVAPVGAGFDVTKGVAENAKPLLSAVGTGAEIASYLTPVKGIKQAMATGAIMGGGAKLSETGDIKEGIKGAALGSALGFAGGALSKAMEVLPKSLTETAFKGLTPEQAAKVLKEKSIGTTENILAQSQKSVEKGGKEIDTILKASDPSLGAGANSIRDTLKQFPEYNIEGGVDKMFDKMKSLVSNSNTVGEERSTILKYMDNIVNGTANLFEKNKVRSALDKATQGGYGKLAKALSPSAGHDLAMTFADALRTEVKSFEPKTIPIFDDLSKEINIRKALTKIAAKKGGLIRWSDLIPFLAGSGVGGPLAGLGAVAAERAAQNPAVQFGAAKVINKVGKGLIPVTSRLGLSSGLIGSKNQSK